jgi:uncharacterized membrane protein YdjX (TVP38/TMEM64 family)
MEDKKRKIISDILILILSIGIAVALVRTGILLELLLVSQKQKIAGNFLAGIFFTSIFTTPPAIAALAEIARTSPLILTAFIGAGGAVIGDLIIFHFVRDRFAENLGNILEYKKAGKRLKKLMQFKMFHQITFLIGGIIIASPLPDEFGVSLLGFSKMRTIPFMLLSFSFNFLGILLIGSAARIFL